MSGSANPGQGELAFETLSGIVRSSLNDLIEKDRLYADPFEYVKRLEYELTVYKDSGYLAEVNKWI